MTDLLNPVERTALLTAALRAAETRREDRLYEDPYAALQLRPGGANSMPSFSRQGSGASTIPDANATILRPGAGTPAPGPMRPSGIRFWIDWLCSMCP